jgi:hypothetical protein
MLEMLAVKRLFEALSAPEDDDMRLTALAQGSGPGGAGRSNGCCNLLKYKNNFSRRCHKIRYYVQ